MKRLFANKIAAAKIVCSALCGTLLLAACSSQQPAPLPGLKESFHTEIAANGAKRFTYSLEMMRPDVPAPYTGAGPGRQVIRQGSGMGHAGPRRTGPGQQGLQFDQAMRQKLAETGFCREGYFEIERSVSPAGGQVRGECREGADR